jgi:hypothetical protein
VKALPLISLQQKQGHLRDLHLYVSVCTKIQTLHFQNTSQSFAAHAVVVAYQWEDRLANLVDVHLGCGAVEFYTSPKRKSIYFIIKA